MRWATLIVMLSAGGCDHVFGLHRPQADAAIPDAPTDAAPDVLDAPPACPPGYNVRGTYKYVVAAVTWQQAEDTCHADELAAGSSGHTHLVVLGGDAERTAILPLSGTSFWIGLTDIQTQGTYVWTSNESPAYPPLSIPPWAIGEPSGSGRCVEERTIDGAFNDTNCLTVHPFLCECDAFVAAP